MCRLLGKGMLTMEMAMETAISRAVTARILGRLSSLAALRQ